MTPTTLYCLECGYNLTGLTESRCPECGERFDGLKLKRYQLDAKHYVATVVLQIILVPVILAGLFPLLFIFWMIVLQDYSDPKIIWFSAGIVAVLAILHGMFLSWSYHLSQAIRFGSEKYNQGVCSVAGHFFLFTVLEMLLAVGYVAGGCAALNGSLF